MSNGSKTKKVATKEIVIKNNYDLAKPVEMVSMAQVLKKHIVDQKLFTPIMGKNYVQVEGWQFAGGMIGIYPRITAVENLSNETEIKWKADAEIVRLTDDKVIGGGFAICSNKENKKKTFDEYAVLSMAQTRAIGKAYRNLIGWVMKLSGYEATPAEDMAKMGGVVPPKTNTTNHTTPTPKTSPAASSKAPRNATRPLKTKEPECVNCAAFITEAEAKFSQRLFKRNLCRICQNLKD